MEVMPPLNFLISYVVIEVVTRTHVPTILTYTYDKQQYRVKLVTFFSKPLKGCIILMDLLHIILAIYANALGNSNPGAVIAC
jgi:hypothetical protein